MSVTFYLASSEQLFPACTDCGGRMNWAPRADPECKNAECQGYGPDPICNTPSLNVSNRNAVVILRILLGNPDADCCCGELDGAEVLKELALVESRASLAEIPSVSRGNFHDCGVDSEQVERYVTALGNLATLAVRRGEPILYA